jgi:hypothetical protein
MGIADPTSGPLDGTSRYSRILLDGISATADAIDGSNDKDKGSQSKVVDYRQIFYQTIGENPCCQLAGRGVREMGLHASCEFDACPPRTSPDDVLGFLVNR